MKLQFEWQDPIALTRNKNLLDLKDAIQCIENVPGIYYFARNFGTSSKPFYIGETMQLRTRLKSHLDTRRIADILRGMKVADAPAVSNGPRSFHFAYFVGKRGQNTKKALKIAQKFMIGEAIAKNIPLLNSQLTVIRTHGLTFSGLDISSSIFKEDNSVVV